MTQQNTARRSEREFDIGDTTQAHGGNDGDIIRDGIAVHERNDCDHVYVAECGKVNCMYCRRRVW